MTIIGEKLPSITTENYIYICIYIHTHIHTYTQTYNEELAYNIFRPKLATVRLYIYQNILRRFTVL